MKRAIVLFGAGASVDFKVPSTSGLTQKIEVEVMADDLMKMTGGDAAFQAVKAGLGSYLRNPKSINFEQIYHCAHELIFTYPPSPGAFDEFRPVMQPFVSNTTGLAEEALRALCGKMVEIIIREVSRSCDGGTFDLEPLARFVETLRADYVTRIYTTNYDDFVLQAVPELYCGFDSVVRPGPKRFEVDRYWRKENWDGIFHLHGSVRMGFAHPPQGEFGELLWFDNRAEALRHSSFSGSSPQRMDGTSVLRTAVITGLEKLSRVQQRPFSHFYSMMARDAMRSDIIFVIGSGLADLHLNTWLAEARSRAPKPPLLFVDYWPKGFEDDTYFEVDPKTINLFHRLQVHITENYRGKRVGNWLVSQDRTAAIWDSGFQAFLNSPAGLRAVLSSLHGVPHQSPLHRLWRRAYRRWSRFTRPRLR
jgi:SIR2-like domain